MEYTDEEWARLHEPLTIKNARQILNETREKIGAEDALFYLVCVDDNHDTWVKAARGCAGIRIRIWNHHQLEFGIKQQPVVPGALNLGDPTVFLFHDSHPSKRLFVRSILIALQQNSALANCRGFMVQTPQVFHV